MARAGERIVVGATRSAYTADWALFTDWCTAAGQSALPADPATVLEFLTDNPAAPATWKRRTHAIDYYHRAAGHQPPGHEAQVARLLRTAAGLPPELTERRLARPDLQVVLRRIPTHGWPAGLFGRRDRLLLLLGTRPG